MTRAASRRDHQRFCEREGWSDVRNDCVDHGTLPARTQPHTGVPAGALPADLVYQLVHTLGLGADEVATMTLDEALHRLTDR